MSAQVKTDSNEQKGTDQPAWKRAEVKKVPMALNPVNNPVNVPIATDTPKELAEPIVVVVTCGTLFQQLTISRPVGYHDLPEDSWIITPTGDVKGLIAVAEDPSAERKEKLRRVYRDEALVRLGLLIKDVDGKLKYPPTVWGGKSVSEAADHAKRAWKEASDNALAEYKADCESNHRQPKKNWKFGFAVGGFYPPAVKAYEETFKEKLKADATYTGALKTLPEYKTLAGPSHDRPQVAARMFGNKPHTREQMVDVIKKSLMDDYDGTRMADLPPASVIAQAFKNAGDDQHKLKEFIFQFAFPGLQPKAAT